MGVNIFQEQSLKNDKKYEKMNSYVPSEQILKEKIFTIVYVYALCKSYYKFPGEVVWPIAFGTIICLEK